MNRRRPTYRPGDTNFDLDHTHAIMLRSTGDIHYIRIAVSDLSKSGSFYTQLLTALGYAIAHQSAEKISFHHRESQFAFILSQASCGSDQYDAGNGPGLHHLAFCASCKDEIDRVFRDVLSGSKHIQILDPPCECPEYRSGLLRGLL